MGRRHQELGSSPRERHAADLFFADLMGTAAARRSAPQQRARGWGRGREDYESYGEAATTPGPDDDEPDLDDGVELPASDVLTPPAPPTVLPAPTAARREDESERIFSPDERRLTTDTTTVAFRFVCSLACVFTNPSDHTRTKTFRGSGTLISNRHVLTAGHNLFHRYRAGSPRQMATRVYVAPGRNDRVLPFGEAQSATLRVAPEFNPGANNQFDFGLITLASDIGATTHRVLGGAQLGFWSHRTLGGGTHIRPLEVAFLRGDGGRPINVDGYPGDKCRDQPPVDSLTPAAKAACTGHVPGVPRLRDLASTQWRAFGRVVDPSPASHPRLMTYNLDTAKGQSGSPVWLRWEQYRNLIGIHTGTFPPNVPVASATANRAVRITDDVLTRVREWMRADGVTPTF